MIVVNGRGPRAAGTSAVRGERDWRRTRGETSGDMAGPKAGEGGPIFMWSTWRLSAAGTLLPFDSGELAGSGEPGGGRKAPETPSSSRERRRRSSSGSMELRDDSLHVARCMVDAKRLCVDACHASHGGSRQG